MKLFVVLLCICVFAITYCQGDTSRPSSRASRFSRHRGHGGDGGRGGHGGHGGRGGRGGRGGHGGHGGHGHHGGDGDDGGHGGLGGYGGHGGHGDHGHHGDDGGHGHHGDDGGHGGHGGHDHVTRTRYQTGDNDANNVEDAFDNIDSDLAAIDVGDVSVDSASVSDDGPTIDDTMAYSSQNRRQQSRRADQQNERLEDQEQHRPRTRIAAHLRRTTRQVWDDDHASGSTAASGQGNVEKGSEGSLSSALTDGDEEAVDTHSEEEDDADVMSGNGDGAYPRRRQPRGRRPWVTRRQQRRRRLLGGNAGQDMWWQVAANHRRLFGGRDGHDNWQGYGRLLGRNDGHDSWPFGRPRPGQGDNDNGQGNGRLFGGNDGHDSWPFGRPGRRGHNFNLHINDGGASIGMSTFGLTDLIGSFAGIGQSQKWWTGPNTCHTSVTDRVKKNSTAGFFSLFTMSECQDKLTAYVCTTTMECAGWKNKTVETLRCCSGFSRKVGDSGCPQQLNVDDMVDTLEDLGIVEFAKAINDSNLSYTLTTPNMTLFTPTNAALASYSPDSVDLSNYIVLTSEEQEDIISEGQRLLEGHLVEGRELSTADMNDNDIMDTMSPASKIRINKYGDKIITANCAKIIKADNFAKTGVVHVIDDVIVQERGTVFDFIKQKRKLRLLYESLSNLSLARTLRDRNSVFTIFAPSNEAFLKLRPSVRRRLFNDGDGTCLTNVLSGHVSRKFWCSAGMQNGTKTLNLLDQDMTFSRDADDNIFINGNPIITDNFVTENGVVHIINEVMSTSAVAMDLAEKEGASHMVSLFNAASMSGMADDLENVTFFFPTNTALEAIQPDELDALKVNGAKLVELLRYHIVNGTYASSELRNGQSLPTRAGQGKTLTVTETVARARKRTAFREPQRKEPMTNIQCARIVKRDLWTCSGKTIVHLIDKVLLPPVGSIIDVMKLDEVQYGTFLTMVRRAGMTSFLNSMNGTGLTLFLPTNKALEVMPPRLKIQLMDTDNLKTFIKEHIVNASICCSSASSKVWGATVGVRTLTDRVVPWRRQPGAEGVLIGRSPVKSCDITATNGIVHVIDGYIVHLRDLNPPQNYDLQEMFDLFDD